MSADEGEVGAEGGQVGGGEAVEGGRDEAVEFVLEGGPVGAGGVLVEEEAYLLEAGDVGIGTPAPEEGGDGLWDGEEAKDPGVKLSVCAASVPGGY